MKRAIVVVCSWAAALCLAAAYYGMDACIRVRCYGIAKEFHDRYQSAELARAHHLTAEQIAADTLTALKR